MPHARMSILIAASSATGLVISAVLVAGFFWAQPRACVENGTDQRLFFTVEGRTPEEARVAAWLDPGKALCLPRSRSAIFTAFASDDAEEGCPRVAAAGGRDRLTQFVATDSCRWASHKS